MRKADFVSYDSFYTFLTKKARFLCKTKGAVKKRAIKKTATTLKRVGKQSFLWYNKFDEKIPTRI